MPPKTGIPSCRLSVILAREAPVGVIFRRGPSKLVELIKWNTDTDTFERGQWFKGRIYEDASDVSADGRLLIYKAVKFNPHTLGDPNLFPTWTAISRPPWLTALALWPTGSPHVWPNGGGKFLDNNAVQLFHHPDNATPHPGHPPHGLRIVVEQDWFPAAKRFARSGWVQRREEYPAEWSKSNSLGQSIIASGSPPQFYECSVVDENAMTRILIERAAWADWDQQGRLVFTRDGKVFAGEFDNEGQMIPQELADFKADVFEPREAPAWAREW